LPRIVRQVFSQGIDRPDQGFAVVFLHLVIGLVTTILGLVLGQDLVHGREVLVDLAHERLRLLLDLRTEQIDDFLRTVDVALEVIQVGVAVAIFLTGDLGRGHFFQQRSSTADHFLWREGHVGDARLQVLDVSLQLVSQNSSDPWCFSPRTAHIRCGGNR
jgi:hypothetical protein